MSAALLLAALTLPLAAAQSACDRLDLFSNTITRPLVRIFTVLLLQRIAIVVCCNTVLAHCRPCAQAGSTVEIFYIIDCQRAEVRWHLAAHTHSTRSKRSTAHNGIAKQRASPLLAAPLLIARMRADHVHCARRERRLAGIPPT